MYVLTEERKKVAQERARLQHSEILLKVKEKKARISNFIRIGEMMERCGISQVDHRILAGGFLFIKDTLKDSKQVAYWASQGESYTQKPVALKKEKSMLHVVFLAPPPHEIRKLLWSLGFSCETTDHVWEGKGTKKEIEGIVGGYGRVYRMQKNKLQCQ